MRKGAVSQLCPEELKRQTKGPSGDLAPGGCWDTQGFGVSVLVVMPLVSIMGESASKTQSVQMG